MGYHDSRTKNSPASLHEVCSHMTVHRGRGHGRRQAPATRDIFSSGCGTLCGFY
jgi:hypothetical protein